MLVYAYVHMCDAGGCCWRERRRGHGHGHGRVDMGMDMDTGVWTWACGRGRVGMGVVPLSYRRWWWRRRGLVHRQGSLPCRAFIGVGLVVIRARR